METSDTVWGRSKATGVDPRSGKPVTIDVVDIPAKRTSQRYFNPDASINQAARRS